MKFKEVMNEMAVAPKVKEFSRDLLTTKDLKVLEDIIDKKLKEKDRGDSDSITIDLYAGETGSLFRNFSKENRLTSKILKYIDPDYNKNSSKNVKIMQDYLTKNYSKVGWEKVELFPEWISDKWDYSNEKGFSIEFFRNV